ncbi:phosphate starvation-inducible protein PhoH, partial [Streptococcus pneumoniae]|nr:phosphate starvation-inducible protein PhoH [Streptococcus pneumoniae]
MSVELDVVIHARTEIVQVLGEESACEEARQVIQALMVLVNRGMTVGTPDVVTAISMVKNDEIDNF